MDVNDISRFKQLFIEEATNLLNSMEGIILELEKNPEDLNLIREIFRVMHTIKGVCGMYGYNGMGELTHNVESIYDLIRNGQIQVNKEILDLTLESVDQLFALINDQNIEKQENKEKQIKLMNWCISILNSSEKSEKTHFLKDTKSGNDQVTYNVILHTNQDVVDQNINIFYVIKDLSELGEIKAINPLPVEADEEERWSVFVVGKISEEDIEDALMFVYEYCIIKKVANYDVFDTDLINKNQLEILSFEQAHQSKAIPESTPTESLNALNYSSANKGSSQNTIDSIRKNMNRVSIESEKLDYLMYLVSELITTNSQINLLTTSKEFDSIRSQTEKLDKLSKLFRNNALDLRLIPLRDILPKFNRLVRDISKDLGKEVEFVTEGMDTELDKSSIDMVAEPLVHLLRNALDHGIESPEERNEKGKLSKGKITFKAYNSGNNIFIKIVDDGKGLDRDKILSTAIKKGLVDNTKNLTDDEVYRLICLPGFSTVSTVSTLSGRGVGMDIVKQKISEMRGELEISSKPNIGSEFTIKLQQSIAIIDTLLIRSEKMKCLLPLSDVEICSQLSYETIKERMRHGTLEYEKELIPFISLRHHFNLNNEPPKTAKTVIVRKNNMPYAFVVDEIIGQHQAVLKPMGELVKRHKEISAASVLGNGEVAFLLDTNAF